MQQEETGLDRRDGGTEDRTQEGNGRKVNEEK
jgi:hypothetical protein